MESINVLVDDSIVEKETNVEDVGTLCQIIRHTLSPTLSQIINQEIKRNNACPLFSFTSQP